jgi:hypothetical protein
LGNAVERPHIGMSVKRHSRAGWDVLDFTVRPRR